MKDARSGAAVGHDLEPGEHSARAAVPTSAPVPPRPPAYGLAPSSAASSTAQAPTVTSPSQPLSQAKNGCGHHDGVFLDAMQHKIDALPDTWEEAPQQWEQALHMARQWEAEAGDLRLLEDLRRSHLQVTHVLSPRSERRKRESDSSILNM